MKPFLLYLFIFVNVILLVSGQILWKLGVSNSRGFNFFELITSWKIWLGLILYGFATIIWLWVLKNGKLSVVYPLQSIAYILGALSGYFFFNEPLSVRMIVGFVFILFGVSMIAI